MLLGNEMKVNKMNGVHFKYGNTEKCVQDPWTYFVDKAWIRVWRYSGSLKLGLDFEVEDVVWIILTLDKDKMAACCEYSNGPSSSIKYGKFLDFLGHY
jgi:hypothetical protein